MKIISSFCFAILIVSFFGCGSTPSSDAEAKTTNEDITIQFEDEVLEGKFVSDKIVDNAIFGELRLTNKTGNKVKFNIRDFVLSNGSVKGRVGLLSTPDLDKFGTLKPPNIADLTKEEAQAALLDYNQKKVARMAMIGSKLAEVSLEQGGRKIRYVKIEFSEKVSDHQNLMMYYTGQYTRLLHS